VVQKEAGRLMIPPLVTIHLCALPVNAGEAKEQFANGFICNQVVASAIGLHLPQHSLPPGFTRNLDAQGSILLPVILFFRARN
jgi:hypothetical protein